MDISLMLGRKEVSEFKFDLDGMAELYREVSEAQQEVGGELCYRAKVPTGGGKSFDIVTGDEDSDTQVRQSPVLSYTATPATLILSRTARVIYRLCVRRWTILPV